MGSTRSLVLVHLDAAFNLARWLVESVAAAEEVVQDACIHAARSTDAPAAGDGLPWVLRLVRSAAYERLRQRGMSEEDTAGDDETMPLVASEALARRADAHVVAAAIGSLPIGDREILVLRELEGLGYDDIATILDLAPHEVPGRLSGARMRFRRSLARLVTVDALRHGCGGPHSRSARTNASSSCSFTSDTAQNDKPSRVQ